MYKKDKIRDEVLIYGLFIMLVLVFIFTGTGKYIKDSFNQISEKMFLVKDKNIVLSKDFTNTYIDSLKIDINELKQIINIKENSNYKCVNASVIYRNPVYWYNNIIINKGLKDGIKKGNMVIDNTGLIGTIKDSLDNSSTINLLTNVSNKNRITIGINYNDNMVYGILDKYDLINNEIIINELTSNIELVDGMKAFTTSFTNTYIEGINIGKVKEIRNDSNGLSKIAIVKPDTDFNNIRYVCVIGEK